MEETKSNEILPSGNPRLIKAMTSVTARPYMLKYELGNGGVLGIYNYLVIPFAARGSLLNLLKNVKGSKRKLFNMIKYNLCSDALKAVI
jgi:hypothetical protein